MLLYHSSNMVIDGIDLAKSRPYKDFGKAFYLSADEEQAREMAKFKVLTGGGEMCITFQYAFCTPLAISKLKKV